MILVTLALFLVTLKKQSHQAKTLIQLELVTLVTLICGVLLPGGIEMQQANHTKAQSTESNVTNITNVTRVPIKHEIATVYVW
jgi:hypothetical protein